MFEQLLQFQAFLLPASLILISVVAGVIVNRIIFARLHQKLVQLPGGFYTYVARALKGMPLVWCVTAGIYAAINSITLHQAARNILENTLLALVLFSSTVVVARMVVGLVTGYAQKAEGILPATSILVNLAEFSTYVVGFLIILQSFGISVTPILTALGVGGLAVALALQDTLSNLFSGLHILLSRQIKLGDYIKLSTGEEGNVADITWRNTTIKGLANNMIVVPNEKIASAIITNYCIPDREVSVVVPVGVSYDSDLAHVEKVTIEVATAVMEQVEGGVAGFTPLVRFHTFGDFSIDFNVIMRANDFANQFVIKHEFIKRLHIRYQQEGIEIPFPVRTVNIQKEKV